MRFSLAENRATVVPLGIADFMGHAENGSFNFNYSLEDSVEGTIVFEICSVENVVLYRTMLDDMMLLAGSHSIKWDGFDQEGIYDSRRFNGQYLQARLTVNSLEDSEISVVNFTALYKEVQWVDIIIERSVKKITAVLRTAFKDSRSSLNPPAQNIPSQLILTAGRQPFKERTKSFEELLALAVKGLTYHWGRNSLHAIAKNVTLADGTNYEFFLMVENTEKYAIRSPKIVYHTNARSRRSRNWELSRILFYNNGYLKYGQSWYFKTPSKADADFMEIAAHEIGHEILLAYGGHRYSKCHKGTSTLLTQAPLGNALYPKQGEIDLMLYYVEDQEHPFPVNAQQRCVASEKDVLSLLWLSKIEVTPI
ncbi:hypothetical protein [Pedobacter sp.]|uniref:hypothetical protein n=1 Tax=Pedobacter sp. TaxID=1411316 RepID=UPI003D7FF353